MLRRLHLAAGLLALLCLATFWLSTAWVELFGAQATLVQLKSRIVSPGLWVMVLAMAALGVSGALLGRSRRGRLVERRSWRMRCIAANGLLVLVPCALALDHWAAAGRFGAPFHGVQVIELLAGAVNFVLLGLNARDGVRLAVRRPDRMAASSGALRRRPAAPAAVPETGRPATGD